MYNHYYIKKEDLERAINSFPHEEYISIGIESDSVKGDTLLWASNGKFGEERTTIRINYKKEAK